MGNAHDHDWFSVRFSLPYRVPRYPDSCYYVRVLTRSVLIPAKGAAHARRRVSHTSVPYSARMRMMRMRAAGDPTDCGCHTAAAAGLTSGLTPASTRAGG